MLDETKIVKFRENQFPLKEVIEKCQPGESIEGLSFKDFNELLKLLENKRGKKYCYSTDKRYGKWRFILFGERSNN